MEEKSFNHGEAKFFWNNRSRREEGDGEGDIEAGRPINSTEAKRTRGEKRRLTG